MAAEHSRGVDLGASAAGEVPPSLMHDISRGLRRVLDL
jgi:hypothetical protein